MKFKHNKRYVAPVLSPDKSKIALVEANEQYEFVLHIMDSRSGNLLWSFKTLERDYFLTPSWSEDGRSIFVVLLRNNQQAIAEIEIESKNLEIILPFANQFIKSPKERGDWLYFVGGYTGIDNIFAINKQNKQVQQKTEARFGVSHPNIGANELVYSNYTADGYRLVTVPFDSLLSMPVNLSALQVSYPVAEKLAEQEGEPMDFGHVKTDFESEKYSKFRHLFNFHSWGPFAISTSEMMVYPGVSVVSQNLLSTTELQVGYKYHTQDKTESVYTNIEYKGLFPVFETSIEYGNQKSTYYDLSNHDTVLRNFDWQQADFDINMYVPLDLSRGKFINRIQPGIAYSLVNRSRVSADLKNFPTGNTHTAKARLYTYSILRKSSMDVLSNFGLVLDFNYSLVLDADINNDNIMSGVGWLYLPGIINNHGVKIYNGFQRANRNSYRFGNYVRMARGYTSMVNTELYTFGADYMFPVVHPDLTVLKFMYFKRIKASLFYDRSYLRYVYEDKGEWKLYDPIFESTGIELTTDVHLFQLLAPLNIGVRINYLMDGNFSYDLLWGVSIDF